jgi:hypothetical protein
MRNTNIDEVKKLNAQSGLTYNEVFDILAKRGLGEGKRLFHNGKEAKNENENRSFLSTGTFKQ